MVLVKLAIGVILTELIITNLQPFFKLMMEKI